MHNQIMQASLLTICLLLTFLALDAHGEPLELDVGDERAWKVPSADNPDAYNHWAERMRFRVGDALRFQYQNDSVIVVDKYGYYHCNSDGPISFFDDGDTVITLERPGFIYFISGEYDHCKNGQRMIVDIMSPHTRSHPSATISPEPGPRLTSSGTLLVSAQLAATVIVSFYALI